MTPLIDGIDFEANELGGHDGDRLKRHPHIVEHDDFLIVGLNSSNWCGVLADYDSGSIEKPMLDAEGWKQVLEEIANPENRERAERSLKSLRLHDLPRVSWAQLNALGQLLHNLELDKIDGRPKEAARIPRIEHQFDIVHAMRFNVVYEGGPLEGRRDFGLTAPKPPRVMDWCTAAWVPPDSYFRTGSHEGFWRYEYRGP